MLKSISTTLCALFFLTKLFADPFPETIQPKSLLHQSYRVSSQYGEEGVLDAILDRIGVHNGFLVEFGGYDGMDMSNTRILAERGWSERFH